MIEKRTVLDQIEIKPNGFVQVRFDKQIVDGGKVIAREWHRTAIAPDTDLDKQMAFVNTHLLSMGYPAVSDIGRLRDHCKVAHTPAVVTAWKAARLAEAKVQAEQEAREKAAQQALNAKRAAGR